jgi:hypothetical protein
LRRFNAQRKKIKNRTRKKLIQSLDRVQYIEQHTHRMPHPTKGRCSYG